MTQSLKAQNSKELKHIHELLREQFGYDGKLEIIFFLSEKKQRLYVFTRDLSLLDISKLRVDTMGLYFGTFYEGLRLTIDATQIIGPHCTKNVVDITRPEMQAWLQGERLLLSALAIPPPVAPEGYVILRYRHDGEDDYLGCGKVAGDNILNYIPKTRYIHALYDDVDVNPV